MNGSNSQAPHESALLLLGAASVVLVGALLAMGPETAAARPGLVWALLLLPALVFTTTARLLSPSLLMAAGILALGLLELARPVPPGTRWWIAGSLATVVVAVGALAFRRRSNRLAAAGDAAAGGSPPVPEEIPRPGEERDPDTGVFQRPLVDLFLHKQLAAARRGEALTVVLVRLEDFEAFREAHGPDAAHQLLDRMERALHHTVRDSDVVGRYGERQFLVLLLGEDHRGGYMFADRVKRKVSRLAVDGADGSVIDSGATVSAGIASFHDGITAPSELVEEAQRVLDDAVRQGGDRILVAPTRSDE